VGNVQMQKLGRKIIHLGATNHVLALHADYSLLGPISMSVPGSPV
jgi:hypothetical protein